jgi:RNA polymerase sigma factor (TIGR02999 family)
MGASSENVTELLAAWRNGDQGALAKLMPLVYDDLRRLANYYMRRERTDHTLQATALIHEAYLRLADKNHPHWQDRIHFYAVAAQLMRRILVDYARSHRAAKHGGNLPKISIDEAAVFSEERAAGLVALDDALTSLGDLNPRLSRIIELRFFGGLTIEETAEAMELSTATVIIDTRIARAWLYNEIYN